MAGVMSRNLRLLLVVASPLLMLAGCCPCDPAVEAEDLAGDSPLDCTAVGDVTAQRDCANGAIATPRAFVLRQVLMGIDSRVESWAIGDASGRLFAGTYDSDPSGGGGACERFDVTPCASLLVTAGSDPSTNAFDCGGAGVVQHLCD